MRCKFVGQANCARAGCNRTCENHTKSASAKCTHLTGVFCSKYCADVRCAMCVSTSNCICVRHGCCARKTAVDQVTHLCATMCFPKRTKHEKAHATEIYTSPQSAVRCTTPFRRVNLRCPDAGLGGSNRHLTQRHVSFPRPHKCLTPGCT